MYGRHLRPHIRAAIAHIAAFGCISSTCGGTATRRVGVHISYVCTVFCGFLLECGGCGGLTAVAVPAVLPAVLPAVRRGSRMAT